METQFLACVHLRACSHAGLIKMQIAFEHKKLQNSNALWVQKLSGCTCTIYINKPGNTTNLKNSFFTEKEKRAAQVGFEPMTYTLLARQML